MIRIGCIAFSLRRVSTQFANCSFVIDDDLKRLEQAKILRKGRIGFSTFGDATCNVTFTNLTTVPPVARLRLLF